MRSSTTTHSVLEQPAKPLPMSWAERMRWNRAVNSHMNRHRRRDLCRRHVLPAQATHTESHRKLQRAFLQRAFLRVQRHEIKGRRQDYSGTRWELERMLYALGVSPADIRAGGLFPEAMTNEQMADLLAMLTLRAKSLGYNDTELSGSNRAGFVKAWAYRKHVASQAQARRVTLASLHVADGDPPTLLQRVQHYFAAANLNAVA